MPKRILQDIIIPSDTTGKKVHTEVPTQSKFKSHNTYNNILRRRRDETTDNENQTLPRSSHFIMWSIATGSTLFFLFVALSFFSGTVVEITPLQKNIVLDENFIASKDIKEGGLFFKPVILEDSSFEEISATVEKELNKKASGTIVIYNNYSPKSQKLIKRTRFETPDGRIYRIDKSIVIPGTAMQNGKIVAGEVETTVRADIPGEKYNIELTDFTIPGFKGDPRFEKFYARSKTAMSGGFSGVVKTASEETIKTTRQNLQNSLKETLLSKIQIPDDFILYEDAVFFTFEIANEPTETTKNLVKIVENAKLYGVIFKKEELSKYIAQNAIASYDGSNVIVQNLKELKFSIPDKSNFNPAEDDKFSFDLSGTANIVWDIDGLKLATDLAGKDKKDFLSIISSYPNIQTFKATVRPFWKKTFPENSEDIAVRKNFPLN